MLTSVLSVLLVAGSATTPALAPLASLAPSLEETYRALHQSPELSLQEEKTAARMAERLRALGLEVTTGVGGHGVVGILRNGKGPTVLLRTDMDALPIKEETGLPYASTVVATTAAGATVPVMHACGHDLHMTSWLGAVTLLAQGKDRWRGTVVAIAQPAEEVLRGAKGMIDDGLFVRFPRPDYALALHVSAHLPAGKVTVREGPTYAMVNGLEIVVHGKGGHGAAPHRTVDPVLIASRIVVALQGIVARETNPLDPAVLTVGSIHGGTKGNIIPDEVKLQLTIRSYKEDVQKQVLAAIARVAKGEAQASGAPREPTIVATEGDARPTVNDPAVAARVRAALARGLGEAAIDDLPPTMGSEDFSEIGHAGIPSAVVWVGTSKDEATAAAARAGKAPGVHTARYAPEVAPSIRTGAATLTLAALELLAKR